MYSSTAMTGSNKFIGPSRSASAALSVSPKDDRMSPRMPEINTQKDKNQCRVSEIDGRNYFFFKKKERSMKN